jgi:hypothetical protein
MVIQFLHNYQKGYRHIKGIAIAGAIIALTGAGAGADCFQVKGHYDEHSVTEGCDSPVGFCIAAEYRGVIKGASFGTATAIFPTDDTATTNVLHFITDSVIHARVHGKLGDLFIKNAGAFQSVGEGNIVDLQTITGGTEELTGASGAIRASGLFDSDTGQGSSEYEGMICLP